MEKGYSESSKEAIKLKTELNSTQKELEDYQPVIQAVWSDPDILNKVRSKLSNPLPYQEDGKPNKPSADVQDNKNAGVQEVFKVLEDQIVNTFWEKHELDKRPEDEQKDLKKKIGTKLANWLPQNGMVNLKKLPSQLEDAWKLVASDSGASKPSGEDKSLDTGKFGGTPSSTPQKKTISLTPEEKKAAKGMGITEEAYAETKQMIVSS